MRACERCGVTLDPGMMEWAGICDTCIRTIGYVVFNMRNNMKESIQKAIGKYHSAMMQFAAARVQEQRTLSELDKANEEWRKAQCVSSDALNTADAARSELEKFIAPDDR